MQILWRPVEWSRVLSNDYVGWDTQDNPGRMRFHSDNSVEVRYFQDRPASSFFTRAAFSITGDIGGEQGDGVTPFGGHHDPTRHGHVVHRRDAVRAALPELDGLQPHLVRRRHLALTFGGGMMNNPGRYLVLAPTGVASPYQPGSIAGHQLQRRRASRPSA